MITSFSLKFQNYWKNFESVFFDFKFANFHNFSWIKWIFKFFFVFQKKILEFSKSLQVITHAKFSFQIQKLFLIRFFFNSKKKFPINYTENFQNCQFSKKNYFQFWSKFPKNVNYLLFVLLHSKIFKFPANLQLDKLLRCFFALLLGVLIRMQVPDTRTVLYRYLVCLQEKKENEKKKWK